MRNKNMEELNNINLALVTLTLGMVGGGIYYLKKNFGILKENRVLLSKLENIINQELENMDNLKIKNKKYRELFLVQKLITKEKKKTFSLSYKNHLQIINTLEKYNLKVS